MITLDDVLRLVLFVGIAIIGIAAAWLLFVVYPTSTRELLGILLVVILVPVAFRFAGSIARTVAPGYNVAEVSVSGPIRRDSTPKSPLRPPVGTSADATVEQIERADADGSVEALLVHLNTPGGEIVPSEDIKLAIERFDGPTIGYATDTCASGGMEIASGCDELWAREGSIVGSIGVIGSRVTLADLADRLGVQYEQLTAGEYKDAGMPLKELEPHERAYLQDIVDDYYDQFVANLADRTDLDPAEIRDTEARIYLGAEAAEMGLVDDLGTREDVEARLEERLEAAVTVEPFEPDHGLAQRLQGGAHGVAHALGAGIASSLVGDEGFELR